MAEQSHGYLPQIKPLSSAQAATIPATENIKGTVKTAIARLCAGLFDSLAEEHELLKQFGRGSSRYETNLSIPVESDRTKTRLAVHKFYEEIKNNIPMIVIADAGCTFKSPGLGFHADVRRLSTGAIAHSVQILREIPVVINVVTLSQEDTEKLTQVLQLYWGDFCGLIHGYRLHGDSEDEHWHVHLPKLPEFGGAEKASLGDDSVRQIWSSIITLTVTYEDVMYLQAMDDTKFAIEEQPAKLVVDFPNTVRIGRKIVGVVKGLDPSCKVIVSDNINVKLLPGERWFQHYVLARNPCEFRIQVVKPVIDMKRPGPLNGPMYTILAEKTITATY